MSAHPSIRKDPVTGYEVQILTDWDEPCRKTYFSNESWRSDDGALFFHSASGGSDGHTNLWMCSGGDFQLLTPGTGWAADTFGVDRRRDHGYLQRGNEIWRVDLHSGAAEPFAELPFRGRATGHFTVSLSGHVVNAFRLESKPYLLAVTTPQGATEIVYRSDTPLGHTQTCPGDDDTIFYVHETGGDAWQRMWLIDRQERTPKPFFVEQLNDWVTHETWNRTGDYITFIYNSVEIRKGWKDAQRFETVATGHFHHCAPSPNDRWIVADDTHSGRILLVEQATRQVTTIATGFHARDGADHCHPSFNRAGDHILFTAPQEGRPSQLAMMDLRQIAHFEA